MTWPEWRRLLPLLAGACLGPLAGSAMVTLVPALTSVYEVGVGVMALSLTVYMLPFSMAQLVSGPISQIFSGRRTATVGFVVFSGASLGCALAPNIGLFLAARLVQGLGAAFLFPILMALIGEVVAPARLGRAMGYLGVTQTLGLTAGPLLAGLLETHADWRGFFVILAALGGGTGWGFLRLFHGELAGAESPGVLGILRQVLGERRVLALCLAGYAFFFATIGTVTFMADQLKVAHGLGEDRIGLLLAVAGVVGIPASPLAGHLADRFGRRPTALLGLAGFLASLGALLLVPYTFPRYLVILAAVGIGSALTWTALNTFAVELLPELRKPVASIYNAFRFFGYASSPPLLAPLYGAGVAGVYLACLAATAVAMGLLARLHEPGRTGRKS